MKTNKLLIRRLFKRFYVHIRLSVRQYSNICQINYFNFCTGGIHSVYVCIDFVWIILPMAHFLYFPLPLCVLIHFDKATSIIYYRKVVQQTSIVVSLAVESTTIITKSNSVNVLHGGDFGFVIFL